MKPHVLKKTNFAQEHHSYVLFVDTHRQPLNLPSIYHYERRAFLSVDTIAIKIVIYLKCLVLKLC